jgi:hypothetical protein
MRRFVEKSLVVLILVGGLVGFYFLYWWDPGRDGPGHARIRAKMQVAQLRAAIETYTLYHRQIPGGSVTSEKRIPTSSLIDPLVKGDIRFLNWSGPLDNGRLVDNWGSEINVTVKPVKGNEGRFEFRIWSNGPDKINNGGTGDDILNQFEASP